MSRSEGPGDFPRLISFRELLAQNELSSIVEIVVAAVAVEFDRCENFVRLPSPVVVVWVYVDDPLMVDFDRLWTPTDPPKKSPIV
jgi:hypothetical protein